MLTLFGPRGGRTFRVVWVLEELGLSYQHVEARPHSEDIYAVNPLGQAPALKAGEHVLTDSLAIANYLADREGSLTHPAGSPERAGMEARVNFVLTEMEAPIWLMARHGFVLPKELRAPGMRDVAEADFARAENKFEILIGDAEFFWGNCFSLADVFAADIARWAEQARIDLTSDVFKAHSERMKARPAWKRTEEKLA